MDNIEITGGGEPVKKINVLDVIASGISPEDFINHAQPGFEAEVDDVPTMKEKIGKNFQSDEEFNAFHNYAKNLASGYNNNIDNNRRPKKSDMYVGADILKSNRSMVGKPTLFLPGELGYAYRESPRRIARNKGTYRFFDEETNQDIEIPINPAELINPFNNFVIDSGKDGDPYLRKLKGSEYDPAYQRYSIWGNDKAYGMSILEPFYNFGQELLLGIPTTIAFAGKLNFIGYKKSLNVLNKATEHKGNNWNETLDTLEKGTEDNVEMWNETLNALERIKWQPSDHIMEGGWFNHGMLSKSQIYNIAGGIGMLSPQKFAAKFFAKISGAVVKRAAIKSLPYVVPGRIIKESTDDALMAATKKVGETVTNASVAERMAKATGQAASKIPETMTQYNYRVQSVMKKAAMVGSTTVGTLQATKGFFDEAKAAGLSDESAMWLTLTAMPAVAATEFLLGKYITKGIGDDMITPTSIFGEAASIKHLRGVIKKEFGDIMATGKLPVTSEAKGFFTNSIMKKAIPGLMKIADKGSNVTGLGGAIFEGLQEGSEQGYYIALQNLYNKFFSEEHGGYFKNKTGDAAWKELKENFWAGFILGGIMDASLGSYKNKQQDKFVESMIVNGQDKELAAIVKQAYKKEHFGLTGLNYNGDQLEKNAPGSGIIVNQNGELDDYGFERNKELVTQNDMNAYNFIQKINIIKSAYNYGVHNIDNITAYGESPSIIKEVLELSKSMMGLESEIKELTEKANTARNDNPTAVSGIETEIKTKQEQLSQLKKQYDDATVPTILDETTNTRYTKRANEKISEIIFSEIEQRPVKISEINDNMEMLNKYQQWKANEIVRLKEIARKRNELNERASKLTFDGSIEGVNDLINELTAQISQSKIDEFVFNPAQLSPEAKQAYQNVLDGINKISGDTARLEKLLEDPMFDSTKGLPLQVRINAMLSDLKKLGDNLKTDNVQIRNQATLMQMSDILTEAINPPFPYVQPDIATEWNEDVEMSKTLEYLLTADNGTQVRDDIRAEIISIGSNLENATDYELQRIKILAEKIQESRKLIKFAEISNNTNVIAKRKVIPLSSTKIDKDNNVVEMGNEITADTLSMATLLLDQLMYGIPDFTINDKGGIEFVKGEDGNVKVYPGIAELLNKLEGVTAQRTVRENKRHRGRAYRNVHMAKYIISAFGHTDIFKTAKIKLVTALDAIDGIFDSKAVNDEKLLEIQNIVIDLMSAMYRDINASGIADAKDFLEKAVDSILQSTAKFYDQTTQSPIKFNYKGYTPARDNVNIEYDDFLEMEFSDFERIVEMIRVREEVKGTLPDGYDYNDASVRDSILSLWQLEMTNFVNLVTTLDINNFYNNYEAIKDKMDFMPSAQQEYAIMQAYALMTSNPAIEFEARRRSLSLYMEEKTPEGKTWEMKNFPISGMFIQAINGGGKTTVIAKSLALMLNEEIKNHNSKATKSVLLVSPSATLSEKLKEQFDNLPHLIVTPVLASEFDKNMELYKDFDYIIYDEATRFPVPMGKTFIDTFSTPSKKTKKKVKFIFLGDPTQSRNGDLKASNVTDTFIGMIMPRTVTVSEVFRTEIFDIARLTQVLQKNIMGLKSSLADIVFPATKYSIDFSEGVYYANNNEEVITRWLKDINTPGIKRTLIVRSALDKKNLINKLGASITTDQQNLIRYINSSTELTEAENNAGGGTIQGDVTEGAYVAFSPIDGDPASMIDFKTAIGRASKFVMLTWPDGISSPSNQITKTNTDEASLKKETDEKKNRISVLAKNRTPITTAQATAKAVAGTPAETVANKSVVRTTAKSVAPAKRGRPAKAKVVKKSTKPIAKLKQSASKSTAAEPVVIDYKFLKMHGSRNFNAPKILPMVYDGQIFTVLDIYDHNGETYYVVENSSDPGAEVMVMNHLSFKKFQVSSTNIVPAEEMGEPVGSVLTNLTKTAMAYMDSGKSRVRISLGSSTDIKPFTKDYFDRLNRVLSNQGEYQIEARFEKMVSLFDEKGEKNNNYNVIGIYAKKGDEEILIGTFYQPYLNEKDLDSNYKKKSLSDNKYENKNAEFQNKENPIEATALNSFNTYLQKLYHKGQKSTTKLLATNIVIQANGGTAQVDYTSPIIAKALISSVLAKGGYILVKDGSTYQYKNSLTDSDYSKIVVQQITTDRGYTTPVIYMSYLPNSSSEIFDDVISQAVRIELNGTKYTDDTSGMSELNEATKLLTDSVNKIKSKDLDAARKEIEELFNNSVVSKVLMFNRWIFRDRAVSTKADNYVLDSKYSSMLSLRKGFLNPVFDNSRTIEELKKNATDTIMKIVERLSLDGYTFKGINNIQKTQQNFIALTSADFANYKTPVKDIFAPQATIISMTVNPEYGNTPPASGNTKININNDVAFLEESQVNNPEYEDMTRHKENLEQIFGEEFVNNSLEIRPNKNMFGTNAWGAVHGFKMILYRNGNKALKGVEYHEAVHYAMRYFIDPESRKLILADMKKQMKLDGIGGEITDKQAEEYLAELARTGKQLTEKRKPSLWKRFVNWFNGLVGRAKRNDFGYEQFLNDLKNGKFKNAVVRYNNTDGPLFMEMEDAEVDSESISLDEVLEIENMLDDQENEEKESLMTAYKRLVDQFGSKSNINQAIKLVRSAIVSTSVFNPVINSMTTRSLVESIDNGFDVIRNSKYSSREAIAPLTNRETYDSLVKFILPEFLVSDRMIEEVFSSNYDTKDIDIKKNLSKALQLIIKSLPKHSFTFVRSNHAGPKYRYGDRTIGVTLNENDLLHRETINWNHLHDAMILASQRIGSSSVSVSKGMVSYMETPLQQWLNELHRMAIDYLTVGDNIEAANNILSFLIYADFTSDMSAEKTMDLISGIDAPNKKVPLSRLVNNFRSVAELIVDKTAIESESQMLQFLTQNPIGIMLREKQKNASIILNAIGTYANSLINNDPSLTEVEINYEGVNNFRPTIRRSSVLQVNKNLYNHGMDYHLYQNDMIKKSVWDNTSGVTNDKATYKVMPNGIYYNQGSGNFIKILEFDGTRFNFVPASKEFSDTFIIGVIRNMISNLGISNISVSTISRIYETTSPTFAEFGGSFLVDQESRRALSSALSRHGLANFLGAAYTAIRIDNAYLNSKEELSKEEIIQRDQIPYLKPNVEAIIKNVKTTFLSESEKVRLNDLKKQAKLAKAVEKELRNGENIRIPGSFDFYLEGLAVMEAAFYAQQNNRYAFGPNGQKIFTQNLKTNLDLLYGKGFSHAHRVIRELITSGILSPLAQLPMFKLRNAGAGSVFTVNKIEKSYGMKSNYEGKSISDFTVNDLINHDIFGHFYKSIANTRTQKRQILAIPIPNPGDSNQKFIVHIQIDGRTDGIRLLEYDRTDRKYVMTTKGRYLLNVMLNMQMDFNFQMAKNAIEAFANVISIRLDNQMDIQPFNIIDYSGNLNDIETHQANIKLINDKLKSYSLNDLQIAFDKAGLIKGTHYDVIDGVLQLGRLPLMTESRNHIYTFENYAAWKRLTAEVGIDLSENSRIFTGSHTLDKMSEDKMRALDILRSQIFFQDFMALNDLINTGISNGVQEPEYVINSKVTYKENLKGNFAVSDQMFMGKKIPTYNPFYESFMYMYHFVASDISANIMGDTAQMYDVTKSGKYFKGIVTQGFTPQVSETPIYGMSKVKNAVAIIDRANITKYAQLFGINKNITETDGLVITSGVAQRFYSHDLGDEMGMSRPGDKTVKSLYQAVDSKTGFGTQIKSSKIVINEDMHDHAVNETLSMIRFMYDRPVQIATGWVYNPYEVWLNFYNNNGQSLKIADEMLYNDIVNHRIATGVDVAANMISDLVMSSTLKIDAPFVNNTKTLTDLVADSTNGLLNDYAIMKLDPRMDRLMLNANQSKTKEKSAAPIQIEEIIGNVSMDAMNGLLALNKLAREKEAWMKDKKKYLQNLLYNTYSAREDASVNLELALNPDVSMSIPQLFGTLIPNISSQLKKGIHKKAKGRKLVQEPAQDFIKYFEVYENVYNYTVDEAGNKSFTVSRGRKITGVSYKEIMDDQKRENPRYDYDAEAVPVQLQHTQYLDEQGNDIAAKIQAEQPGLLLMIKRRGDLKKEIMDLNHIMSKTKKVADYAAALGQKEVLLAEYIALQEQITAIRQPYISSISRIAPAQVAMEWTYHQKFGLDPNVKVTMNDLFTLTFNDGSSMNIREYLKEKSLNYYKSANTGIAMLKADLAGRIDDISEDTLAYQGLMNLFGEVSVESLASWYNSLAQSTIVFGVRVPSSLWGSSFVGEITTITHDSPSIIYTSHEKNVFDDSDYDIDQLTIFSRNIKIDKSTKRVTGFEFNSLEEAMQDLESVVANSSTEDIENIKFQMYVDFMLGVSNMEKLMSMYDLDTIKQHADRISPNRSGGKTGQYNSSVSNHQNSHDGKNLVAYAANAIHNVSTLLHMPLSHQAQFIPGIKLPADGAFTVTDEFGTSKRHLITELALFLQLAVDNVKHMTAGRLNFNPATVNVGIGLVISGHSAEQTFDILADWAVKRETDKVLASMSIDQFTKSLYETINNKLTELISKNTDEYLEEQYNERKKALEKQIKELSHELTNLSEADVAEYYPTIEGQIVGKAVNFAETEDGLTINELSVMLKEYQEEYTQLSETPFDQYVDVKRKQQQAEISKFTKVLNATLIGEAMSRVSSVLKYYNNLPSTHADLYTEVKRLEWIMRTELNDIPMEHDTSRMFQKVTAVPNAEFYNSMLQNRIRYMEGANSVNVTVPFIAESQHSVNERVDSLFSRAIEILSSKEFNGTPILEQLRLVSVNGGQLGIDFAGNVTTLKHNIPTVVIMPAKFRHRSVFGADIYSKTKEQIIDMYRKYANVDKLIVQEAGVDVEIKDNPLYYNSRTKHVIGESNHVLSITVNNSPEMRLTNKEAAGKITQFDAMDFSSDELLEAAAQTYANDLYKKMSDMLIEANKFGVAMPEFRINITGNGLDSMATKKMSEAEAFIDMENKMDDMINLLGVVRSNRAMNAYFTVLKEFRNMTSETFYQLNPEVTKLAEEVSIMAGGNGVLSKANYIKVVSAIDAVFAKAYLERAYAGKTINTYLYGDYKENVSLFSSSSKRIEDLPAGKLNPGNIDQLNTFINIMPAIVRHYKNSVLGYNSFIDALTYDSMGNLFIRDLQNMTEESITNLRNAFAKLDPEFQEMFNVYNLAMVGFKNKMNSLSPIMNIDFYIDYSSKLEKLQEEFKNPDSDFTKEIKQTFTENTIALQENIVRKLSATRFRNLDNRPPYARNTVMIQEFGFKRKSDWTQLVRYNPNWDGKQVELDMAYTAVRNRNSKRMKGVQEYRRGQLTELDVIHLTTEQQVSEWVNNGSTTIYTRRAHNYSMSNDSFNTWVVVDGAYGKIVSMTDTSVTVVMQNDEASRVAKRRYLKELKAETQDGSVEDVLFDSIAIYDGKPLTKKAFRRLMAALQKANPSLKVVEVNNSNTQRPNVKGYFHNGTIYYNSDLITHDTPLHEVMHFVLIGMLQSNDESILKMGNQLMDMAQSQIDNKSELYMAIKSAYPDLSGIDLQMEIAVTIVGMVSENKVKTFVENSKSTWEKIGDFVLGIWTSMNNIINSIFYSGNTASALDADYPVRSINLNIDSTYQDLVNNVIEMVFNGQANMIMDEVTEMDLVNRMDSRPLHNLNTPQNVNPKSTRTFIKALTDIKELEDELLLGGDLTDVDTRKKENMVNSIYHELLTSNDKQYLINGESFDLTEYMVPGKEIDAKNYIRTTIIPQITKAKDAASESLFNLMNSGDIFNGEALDKAFTVRLNNRDVKMYSRETIGKALSLMEFLPGQAIVKLSKLQTMESIYPGLSKAIPQGFLGADPYVIIHSKKDKGNGIVYDISIYDISTEALNFYGKGLNSESLITDNYLDSPKARAAGVVHKADLRSARQIILAIQMMAIKKNLPTVNIRKTGVIELIPYRGSRKNAGYLSYTPVNMNMVGPEISVIANSSRFTSTATPEMVKVLTTPELYDPQLYNPDYVDMLIAAWGSKVEELSNIFGEETKGVGIMKHRLQSLQDYVNGKGDLNDVLRVVRLQKDFLESRFSLNSDAEKFSNIEYRMLVLVENSLTALSQKGAQSRMNAIHKFFATTYNQPNELVQNYVNLQRNLFSLIVDRFKNETKGLDERTKPYVNNDIDKLTRLLKDTSDDYFRKMFIQEEIDGRMVNLGRLHWDPTDPRTVLAMKGEGGLTMEDLKYTNYILDIVEKHMKNLIRQRYVNENKYTMQLENGDPDMKAINEAVEIEFARNWDRGLLPVMTKTPSQMIMTGKGNLIVQGIAKWFQQVANPQTIFSEMIDLNNNGESVNTIKSLFENQIMSADNHIYGGNARLRGLGLEYINGKIRVIDQAQNDALSLNVYSTVKYLVMDSIQKEVVENDLLPAYNNAVLLGKILETTKGEDYDIALDYLTETFAQNVAGRHTITAKEEKNLAKLAAGTRALIKVSTFAGVALSVPVMMTSLTANAYEALSNAIANTVANPYGMFTIADEINAIIEISTNLKKVRAFEQKYQTIESERRDMLSQQKYDITRLNFLDENFWHGMNRATDISARRVAMVAQALRDGSYQAHDSDGNYDIKKDKRYFNEDGTQSEEQKALAKGLVQDLINDKYPGQKESKVPLKAYSYTEQRFLEMVGTQMGVGVFGQEAGAVGGNHLWFSVLMQYKKFVSAAIGSRISGQMETIEGGRRMIKRDKITGEAVRDAFGEIVTEFVKMKTEGTWHTGIRLGGEILSLAPIIGDIMIKTGLVMQPRTFQEIMNLTPLERRNLVKAALDVVMFFTAYMIYTGMIKDIPDDEKKNYKKYGRLIAAIKNGFDTSLIASPVQVIDMATNIAVLQNARRMLSLFTLGSDAGKEMNYLLPFGGTAKLGYELYNAEEE